MTADSKIRYTTKTFTLCEVSESEKGKSSAAAGAQPCLDAAQSGIALAVFANSDGVSAGALYMSGGAHGEMRIELEPPYDTPAHVDELLELAIPFLVRRCGAAGLRCDVSRSPGIIPLLARYGFERVDDQYYARPNVHRFNASRGLAYCGLACCVCGEGEDCAGCRNMGCASYDSCRSFGCCASTGRAGCWQCDEFPCDWTCWASCACGRLRAMRHCAANRRCLMRSGEMKRVECCITIPVNWSGTTISFPMRMH